MKTFKIVSGWLLAIVVVGCSKDEPQIPSKQTPPPTETPLNKAPGTFDLIDVIDDAENVDVRPTFTWQAAVDPDGDAITYDLYLGTEIGPLAVFAENLTAPNFTIADRLHLITDYDWKVIAKDAKGATVSSAVHRFTTRNLNLPEQPFNDETGFSGRRGHTSVIHDGQIWVIGGSKDDDREVFTNEIWKSTDGQKWTNATPSSTATWFHETQDHASVSFKGKLWVIGGRKGKYPHSEVWYSEQGTNWTLATNDPGFSAREGHTLAVYQDKMWLLGGRTYPDLKNDVWYTTDGVHWVEATSNAAFSPREGLATAVFDNKLWVIGGSYTNDVWYSTDGIAWTEATSSAKFRKRVGHTVEVYDNKMWLIGGQNNEDASKTQQIAEKASLIAGIWYSTDGIRWVELQSDDAGYIHRHSSVVFNDKIWIIGGSEYADSSNWYSKSVWGLD